MPARALASGGSDTTILLWNLAKAAKAAKTVDPLSLSGLWSDLAGDAAQAYAAVP